MNYRDFIDLRAELVDTPLSASMRGTRDIRTNDGGAWDSVAVSFVSGEFFQVAGVHPAAGRLLNTSDEPPGHNVVVLSDAAWSRLFNRSAAALGSTIVVGDRPFMVVGVSEQGFTGPAQLESSALWLPAGAIEQNRAGFLSDVFPSVFARLPTEAARVRFRSQAAMTLARGGQRVGVDLRGVLSPIRDARPGPVMPFVSGLVVMIGTVGLANLAGFLVTMASARQREVGIRLALGATRARLIRQFLTESLLVGVIGAVAGLLVAQAFIPLLDHLIAMPIDVPVTPDVRAYVFLVVMAVVTSVSAGLTPIRYAAKTEIASDLSGDGRRLRALPGPERLRSIMVGAQVAVSIVLLVASALLTRAATRVRHVDVGFDVQQLLTVSGRHLGGDWSPAEAARYWPEAIARARGVPGVENAALVLHTFGGGSEVLTTRVDNTEYRVSLNRTSSDYFATAGIAVIRGRPYSGSEVATDAKVAVVTLNLARHLWGLDHAIGSSLAQLHRSLADVVVIGVVGDVVPTSILDLSNPVASVFRPLSPSLLADASLLVRTRGDARPFQVAVQHALPVLGTQRPPPVNRVAREVDGQIALVQVPARIATLAGLAILVLTAVGLQGLVAFVVRQRLKAIAVRIVLGAEPWAIVRYTAGLALMPALWGLAAGCVGAFVTVRAMSAMLFGLSGFDPWSLAASAALLVAAAGLGIMDPMIRVLRLQPADVLRND